MAAGKLLVKGAGSGGVALSIGAWREGTTAVKVKREGRVHRLIVEIGSRRVQEGKDRPEPRRLVTTGV